MRHDEHLLDVPDPIPNLIKKPFNQIADDKQNIAVEKWNCIVKDDDTVGCHPGFRFASFKQMIKVEKCDERRLAFAKSFFRGASIRSHDLVVARLLRFRQIRSRESQTILTAN